jgi:RNA polymerase sigma factor for flagellar operon FliA
MNTVRVICKIHLQTTPRSSIDGSRARPPTSTCGVEAAKLVRRDKLVLEHLPLAKAIAGRVQGSLPVHVDLDDMVHSGVLGLIDAANKFNSDMQVPFSSYAKHRIKGAILDGLRHLDWASRDMRRRQKSVEAATGDLTAILERAPTEAEVAEKLGIDVDHFRKMMLDLRTLGPVSPSNNFNFNENGDLPALDFPDDPKKHPDASCAQAELRGLLGEARKTLPTRYQQVVLMYYTGDLTMKEIGGVLGINESRVSQIHKSALEKMNASLQLTGITSSHAFFA